MESQSFDPSIIVLIVLGIGFVALVVAVVAKMAGKKKGRSLSPSASARTRDSDDEDDRFELVDQEMTIKRGGRGDRSRTPESSASAAVGQAQRGSRHQDRAGSASADTEKQVPALKGAADSVAAQSRFRVDISSARRLQEGLSRTRSEGFIARLSEAFGRSSSVDEATIAAAEEALLTADMGVATAMELSEGLRRDFQPSGGPLAPQVMAWLKDRTYDMIRTQPHGMPGLDRPGLNVVMVVGVNGTGKTTNIAKLANWYRNRGRKVLLAAGDTYRAAGADQLGIWAERLGIDVVVGRPGQDPSSLFFDAARKATEEGFDIMIADTAGRLHTDTNLVDELKKVARVLGKAVPDAPHQVLLMLDATMGQNAVRQADVFLKSVNVSGIGLSKLDGTARGGVVVSIARDMNLPIWFVGVGEAVDDLRSFQPEDFVNALFAAD
ncbi:MAG TPA: signal recognition particle-docking protein FtsY [Myxococcota bacterium]|nr:signal recognition particle-docking protein FtsY [Myxococcota bacterium]